MKKWFQCWEVNTFLKNVLQSFLRLNENYIYDEIVHYMAELLLNTISNLFVTQSSPH